jgi:hypothetical protein
MLNLRSRRNKLELEYMTSANVNDLGEYVEK